jgi:hypothetical protein
MNIINNSYPTNWQKLLLVTEISDTYVVVSLLIELRPSVVEFKMLET